MTESTFDQEKSHVLTEFSHQELSLLLFALEGSTASAKADPPSCEEACPIVEDIEEILGATALPHNKQLTRHLNNHLREGLIECGMFDLMGATGLDNAPGHQEKLRHANERLGNWSCKIKLNEDDRRVLYEAISRLPRSAWLSMPRTLWRLRRKLRA